MLSNRHVTPLELFVISYFKTISKKHIDKNFVRKALALVDEKLGNPCCASPSATINLYTRKDNDLTNMTRAYLLGISKEGNVKSLQRIKTIFNNFITPGCCA